MYSKLMTITVCQWQDSPWLFNPHSAPYSVTLRNALVMGKHISLKLYFSDLVFDDF